MNKYNYQKNMLEMQVTHDKLQKAINVLESELLSFEFDHYFDISEVYLGYSIDIETMFTNAVHTLNEIKSALHGAIEEIPQTVNTCTFCGRKSIADTHNVNGYIVLMDCETCEDEIKEND